MAEGADKMGVVGESGQLAGLLHADPFLEKLARLQDAAVDDILHDGETGGRLEDAAQVVLANEKFPCNLIQCQWFGQVVPDVIQNGSYPQKVLVADGFSRTGYAEHGGNFEQKIEQSDGLVDITAKIAIILVAFQCLEKLDDFGHLCAVQRGTAESVAGKMDKVSLGRREIAEGFPADMENVTGVGSHGHGAVQGIFTNEVKGSALQGIDLIVDEDVAWACKGKQEFVMIMEMKSAHVPSIVLIEREVEFNIIHRHTS